MHQVVETSQNFLDYAWKISRFFSWLTSTIIRVKSASQATPGWKPPYFNCQCFYSITSQYWPHYVFVTCANSGFSKFDFIMHLCAILCPNIVLFHAFKLTDDHAYHSKLLKLSFL